MLQIKHISKTFNKGTVNEKQALRDLSLTLKDGDFVTSYRRKWCRQVYYVKRHCRSLAGGRRTDHH